MKFFCQTPKNIHPSFEKCFWRQSFAKRETVFFEKNLRRHRIQFFQPRWKFLSVVRNFSPLLKNSHGIFKQIANCLFFFKNKNSSLKRFFWQIKTQNWQCCWLFLPKSDIFPLNDWKTILDHYFSNNKNIFLLNKSIWTQWCAFHESVGKFRQNVTKLDSSCENVFANETFPRKKSTKSSLEAWNPAMTKVLIFSGQKSIFFKFFKKLRSISERKYQTVKKIFKKETISLKKSSSRQTKRIFDNRLEIHRQSMTILRPRAEKNSRTFFSQKKNILPQYSHLGTGTPFW